MGLFDLFFGDRRRAQTPSKLQPEPRAPTLVGSVRDIDRSGHFVEVPSARMYGQAGRSPNGRFTLVWRDGTTTQQGARSSGLGRYVLLDGEKVIVQGRMERPNDGNVADNGVFILNDWQFASELSGSFRAFRADGSEIICRAFNANLYNNAISPNGRHAVCQTCNSSDQRDANRLTIFDLELGVELGGCRPESGWASDYEFPSDRQVILLHTGDRGKFAYAFDGTFVDRAAWIEASLRLGDMWVIQSEVKAFGKDMTAAQAETLIQAVEVMMGSCDERFYALGHKLKGQCLDATGDFSGALNAYSRALKLDPKVGVKRRIEQLQKLPS